MKKKLISLIASLSLAFGLTTSAISKDPSREEQRVQQYQQFYKEYNNKSYKLIKSGELCERVNGEFKTYDILEIVYGNNIYDNKMSRFAMVFDAYLPKIDKKHFNYKGPDSSWYFTPYTPIGEARTAMPLGSLDREKLPQVMRDILTLPGDLQKKISSVIIYRIDGDVWLMLDSGPEETVRRIYDHLKSLSDSRNAQQKDPEGQIQPIIPTENQFLPLDPFFPSVRYIDENGDGKADYAVELYSMDGSWFNPKAEKKYFDLLKWFELRQDCAKDERLRKHDKPFKITIDFDRDKGYEHEGFDIEFYDENHDGYFERYKILG